MNLNDPRHRKAHGYAGLVCPVCLRTAGWMTVATLLVVLIEIVLAAGR